MDSVAGTIRVSPFWAAGDTGSGIRGAVVEEDPIDFGNPHLHHADGGTGPAEFEYYYDDLEHATRVAGVIAMKNHAVRNAGVQDASITLYYYDASGNPVGTPHPETIEAEGMANIGQRYNTALGGVSSLDGSGVLVSDQPVAVVVNRRHDPPGDNLCSYNGLAP